MPNCYLVAVCSGSSLDRRSNNYSLFNLIEQLRIRSLPANVALQVHAYYEFDQEERGRSFELRIVVSDGAEDSWTAPTYTFAPQQSRHRLRLQGLRIPAAGRLRVRAEVRAAGTDLAWERSSCSWPLHVEIGEPREAANTTPSTE